MAYGLAYLIFLGHLQLALCCNVVQITPTMRYIDIDKWTAKLRYIESAYNGIVSILQVKSADSADIGHGCHGWHTLVTQFLRFQKTER